MVKYRRNKPDNPDTIYFLTLVLSPRKPRFQDIAVRRWIYACQRTTQVKYGVRFHAWAILPDHVHWLIQPAEIDYSQFVRAFKRQVTARLRAESVIAAREIIWQDRFWEHTVRDARDYSRCMEYIHWNPVKHELVTLPEHWPSTSLRQCIAEGVYGDGWNLGTGPVIPGAEWD